MLHCSEVGYSKGFCLDYFRSNQLISDLNLIKKVIYCFHTNDVMSEIFVILDIKWCLLFVNIFVTFSTRVYITENFFSSRLLAVFINFITVCCHNVHLILRAVNINSYSSSGVTNRNLQHQVNSTQKLNYLHFSSKKAMFSIFVKNVKKCIL